MLFKNKSIMEATRLLKNNGLAIALFSVLLMLPACSLTTQPKSVYTPGTFFKSDYSVLSALSGVYRNLASNIGMGPSYRLEEVTTDEEMVLAKIQGWWYSPHFLTLEEHTWASGQPYIYDTWNGYFNLVGQANALIASLQKSSVPKASLKGPIAELRSLRAIAYFHLMDLFGNVPVFTAPKVDPNNLPKQNTRNQVFDFVVKELSEAAQDLPSQNDVGSSYYGRLTKEADWSYLAIVYLNAKVYTGTAQYGKAIAYSDSVINSGAYHLAANYFDNFAPDNQNCPETIFAAVEDPNQPGGIGTPFVLKTMSGISGGLFGLPYTPQDGFSTRLSIKNLYEDQDVRKKMFLGYGPLVNPQNGDTVKVEKVVPDGNSTLYKKGVSTQGPTVYNIIKPTGLTKQPMNAGILWLKWQVDPNTNGGSAGNDFQYVRYADILLIKAEALLRSGGSQSEALDLVNQVRERSNATPLKTLTLDNILNERARELCFEMVRRRDLIRFGKFTDAWQFKPKDDGAFRDLFPIPHDAIVANPNLKQNPGYQP